MWHPQAENTTGRLDTTTPSEYVSVGVLSAPYHGLNVDGVKAFTTDNGNSVSSNVVTEAAGAALTTLKGYFSEGQAINNAIQNRDFSNVAWAKTNITGAKDAVGIDGQPNSASTLTATAGNGTAFQTVTIVSAAFNTSFWVRRKTGTGVISITDDNGGNYTAITSLINSSTYTLVEINRTQANPVFGFKITTDTDAIEVDFAGLVETGEATSPIETAATAVTRKTDNLLAYDKQNVPVTNSGEFELTPDFVGTLAAVELIIDLGNSKGIQFGTTAKSIEIYDGTNTVALTNAWAVKGQTIKVKWYMDSSTSKMNISADAVKGTAGTYADITASQFKLINISLGASEKTLKIYNRPKGDLWLQQ